MHVRLGLFANQAEENPQKSRVPSNEKSWSVLDKLIGIHRNVLSTQPKALTSYVSRLSSDMFSEKAFKLKEQKPLV